MKPGDTVYAIATNRSNIARALARGYTWSVEARPDFTGTTILAAVSGWLSKYQTYAHTMLVKGTVTADGRVTYHTVVGDWKKKPTATLAAMLKSLNRR